MENLRLRVFRTVAQDLNFRKAAEVLLISQPAVTQQIKALEEEIGTALFDRTRGRVSLTRTGSVLLDFANRLKTLADEAAQAVTEVSGAHHDQLRVGASQTIGQYLLPNLLAGFLKAHGEVPLSGTSGNTDEVLQSLADHTIDLALIEGPTLRRDVQSVPFMEDHMVLVVPPGHEWADSDVPVQLLPQMPLIARELGSGSRRVVENALSKAGLRTKDLHIALTLDSTEGQLSAVEAGLGVAFASRWAVRNQLSLGTLRLARVKGVNLSRTFSVARRMGPIPSGSAGAFHRFLLHNAYASAPRTTGRAAAKADRTKAGGSSGSLRR